MAKCEYKLNGNFSTLLHIINNEILNGSVSASLEDRSDFQVGDVRCAVRVYERYSVLGKNRVSLNITLLGVGDDLSISAITAGGSQAVFFKLNTFGEEAFLNCLTKIVENYRGMS